MAVSRARLVQLALGVEDNGGDVLLLDEPTSGLDLHHHQLGMLDALRHRASRGVLVVAILHDLNLAALFAQRIIVLAHGHIDSQGCPKEVITAKMLERVFDFEAPVSEPPRFDTPFALPQTMTLANRFSAGS